MDNNNFNETTPVQETPVQATATTDYTYSDATTEESKGLAIASLILGILSILCGGGIFGIVGLILAIVAKKKGQAGPHTVGLILSIVGLVLGLIGGIVWMSIFGLSFIAGLMDSMFLFI